MSGGFGVDPAGTARVAAGLDDGVTRLEAAAAPPPAPDVGILSGVVAAALSRLAEQNAGASETLAAAAEAVRASVANYHRADAGIADGFGPGTPR